MVDISILGVAGTADGIAPVYQPEARWCWWGLHEIFTGEHGENRYVPKLSDYVMDATTYTTYIVDHLDPVTLIPTLREIRPANMSFSLSETDVLFGVGPGTQADTYRVYLDKSVVPYVLAVDNRLKIGGSMASHAKIFRGSMLGNDGEVISKIYDSNGNFVSENVGLELVAIDSHINYSIKTVAVCHTTTDLPDGEIVTVVIYNAQGHVVSKRQLLVENTSFIRSLDASKKYVSHISLESPFLSATNDHVIDFPLNIPTNALNLTGVVHYSDGSMLKLPVDGTKFKMFGLEQYVSTIVGQNIGLVLSYTLAANEVAYAGVSSDNHYVTEPYSLITTNPNNSYTVKLFGYPRWIDVANGYTMDWWLHNLDRNVFYNVTPYVSFSETTGAFNPKAYGIMQRKLVAINLRDISGAFKPFIHTQLVEITLNGAPDEAINPWLMSHESVTNRPAYGAGLYAKKIDSFSINLASDLTDYSTWLQHVYLRTYPLVDRTMEINPPTPTHFIVNQGNTTMEFPITDWNVNLGIGINVSLYTSINIHFIKRSGNMDMKLATAVMMVKQ